MRKTLKICGFAALFAATLTPISAHSTSLDDWEKMGAVAGVAYSCGSVKLDLYEEIISSLMLAEITTEKGLRQAAKAFARGKAEGLLKQKDFSPMSCSEAVDRFDAQKIFQTQLLDDGTIITPDGKTLKIRNVVDKKSLIPNDTKTTPTNTTNNPNPTNQAKQVSAPIKQKNGLGTHTKPLVNPKNPPTPGAPRRISR